MAGNLKTIRQQIEKLTAERQAVLSAIEPADVLEAKLRAHLAELAKPIGEFTENLTGILNGADATYTTPATPFNLARAAFGLSLTPDRIEQLVAEAKAKHVDTGALRMTIAVKADRLADLATRIYELGLAEQEVIGDEAQRQDVNPAALLHIPVDIAVEHDLI